MRRADCASPWRITRLIRCVNAFATDHHVQPRLGFVCNPLDVASACYASVALTLIKALEGRSGIPPLPNLPTGAVHVTCFVSASLSLEAKAR